MEVSPSLVLIHFSPLIIVLLRFCSLAVNSCPVTNENTVHKCVSLYLIVLRYPLIWVVDGCDHSQTIAFRCDFTTELVSTSVAANLTKISSARRLAPSSYSFTKWILVKKGWKVSSKQAFVGLRFGSVSTCTVWNSFRFMFTDSKLFFERPPTFFLPMIYQN